MKKNASTMIGASSLFSGLVLACLAIGKLVGVKTSVTGFAEMAEPLERNPTSFKMFKSGKIVYVLDTDYRNRAEPSEITDVIEHL